jgi:hypothetical protein
MADRIVAKVITNPTVTAKTFTPRNLQATSIGISGGIAMADLSDVVIPDSQRLTGALMTYDAERGGFVVLSEISSPNLKLNGGAL